ncbi:MAG: site-specific integrase [Alphaproteobacteria bacterium]|nr:site-specific integrase [Alphaproteobacteria bacterium]
MASIQKRTLQSGETSYRVQVRLKGHPVQRATFSRLTDAKKWAQSTEAAVRERRYFKSTEATKHTLSDMADRYLEKLKRENPSRYKDVRTILEWWKKEIGYCVLVDLSRSLISEQIEKLVKKTVIRRNKDTGVSEQVSISASRVNRYISALSHVCTVAVNEWEWMEENPFSKIKKLREPSGRTRFLTDSERENLLAACKEAHYPHLYLIVILALSTGARRSEILNLRWPDVDLQRQQIVLQKTKNGEKRTIPLKGHALELVLLHHKVRRIDTDMLFPSQKGDKPYEIKKGWEGALQKADIQDFRFHDLRHSAASYLAMNGASLMEIAEVLGHKTLQMVKRYAHLSEAHTGMVVESMNERIFSNGN